MEPNEFHLQMSSALVSPEKLPIHKFRNELLFLIENNSVVIVVGQTGSGKTTQIPKFLLEQGWTGIACTQPRRIAAIAMAERVSQELGIPPKREVSYSVRFDDATGKDTRCRFITDGMLFREFLNDPLLSRYSIIMIDEAHERSLHTDLLLALLKKVLQKRPDLRLIISSATLDAKAFQKYFTSPKIDISTGKKIYGPDRPLQKELSEVIKDIKDDESVPNLKDFIPSNRFEPKIIGIEGRAFPVQVEFLLFGPKDRMIQSEDVIVDAVVRLVRKINEESNSPGDILVFLAGRSEIEKCSERLVGSRGKIAKIESEEDISNLMGLFNNKKKAKTSSDSTVMALDVLQLYAGMHSSDQLRVFEPTRPGNRKVILATSIAEASITIDGIAYVIDSGRVKVKCYDGFEEKMEIVPISKASADQRAGRAGRTRPGKTFRLYTKEFFENHMEKHNVPDIQRCRLTSVILQLKAMSVNNFESFDFLSPLPAATVNAAIRDLTRLDALNPKSGALNDPFGKQMSQLPLDPEFAHLLLRSVGFDCVREAAALVAMLTIQNQNDFSTFFLAHENNANYAKYQRRFWAEEGDHLSLLNAFMSYQANFANSVKFCQKYGLNLKNLAAANRLYTVLLKYLDKVFKLPINRSRSMKIEDISINLRKCLISAFPLNIAKSDEIKASYFSLSNPQHAALHIHPNSVLFKRLPPLIVYGAAIETSKTFLKFVSFVEPDWVAEIHPQMYKQVTR